MKHMKDNMKWIGLLLLAVISTPGDVYAQRYEAFCSLRDPVREIRLLVPGYRLYESNLETISAKLREEILKEIPFDVHFDELGKHTLYRVEGSEGELSFVHVRSEAFKWGLVRIAWRMNSDLEVIGFRFQRCRSPYRNELESSEEVLKSLVGKSTKELRVLLSEDGQELRSDLTLVSEEAQGLLLVLIQSAIKTRVVTGVVWPEWVGEQKATELSRGLFGENAEVNVRLETYDQRAQEALQSQGLRETVGFSRAEVRSWTIQKPGPVSLGEVYFTPWAAGGEAANLYWVLDVDGRILAVEDAQGTLSKETKSLFSALVGRLFEGDETCSTACELAALEVSLLHAAR
jgi:hypothetical protein